METSNRHYHLPLCVIVLMRFGNGPSAAAVSLNGLLDPGTGEKCLGFDFCSSKRARIAVNGKQDFYRDWSESKNSCLMAISAGS